MNRLPKTSIILIGVAAMAAGAGAWYFTRSKTEAVSYHTAAVKRGDLLASIGATGTVEPEEVVDIGAQVAGQISSFGKDKNGKTIDYGSAVEEGTVLAKIDDSLYAADVAQAKASLELAKAGVQRAQADLLQMKAKLYQAQRDWDRAQKLGPSEALAQASYDAYQSAYETAKANVAVDEAAIVQAQDTVAQAQASLDRAGRNLSYCTITSPVKGVIIDRRVNIGQTVVSSLNAPSLFLLAKDLHRMQVWVSVNEADIGNIHPGQPVSFTVDAFPGLTFQGEVGKIRLNATMTQNVVTYTVEVITDNSNGKLLPYLTANVQFELGRRTGVLLAPNAALHWTPSGPEQIAPEFRAAPADNSPQRRASSSSRAPASSRPAASTGPGTAPEGEAFSHGRVWARQGAYVRPVKVRAGMSDKTMTEVQGEDLKEGMEIVVGEQHAGAAPGGSTNPFTPQLRSGRTQEQEQQQQK